MDEYKISVVKAYQVGMSLWAVGYVGCGPHRTLFTIRLRKIGGGGRLDNILSHTWIIATNL